MKRFLWVLLVLPLFGYADTFENNTAYQVCFTPGQDCTALLVKKIDQAKQSIYVQAYSFTSGKIAHALYNAHQRGVDVKIIFDKSQFDCRHFSYAGFFIQKGLAVWDDSELNIAHNKSMIIDNTSVETGSFNFTKSAQRFNAENMLIIDSPALAKSYLANWQRRLARSESVRKNRCYYNYY